MSMRSEASMDRPVKFKSGDTKTDLRYIFILIVLQHVILYYTYLIYIKNAQIAISDFLDM